MDHSVCLHTCSEWHARQHKQLWNFEARQHPRQLGLIFLVTNTFCNSTRNLICCFASYMIQPCFIDNTVEFYHGKLQVHVHVCWYCLANSAWPKVILHLLLIPKNLKKYLDDNVIYNTCTFKNACVMIKQYFQSFFFKLIFLKYEVASQRSIC